MHCLTKSIISLWIRYAICYIHFVDEGKWPHRGPPASRGCVPCLLALAHWTQVMCAHTVKRCKQCSPHPWGVMEIPDILLLLPPTPLNLNTDEPETSWSCRASLKGGRSHSRLRSVWEQGWGWPDSLLPGHQAGGLETLLTVCTLASALFPF